MKLIEEKERAFLQKICATLPTDELMRISGGHYARLTELVGYLFSGSCPDETLVRESQILQDISYKRMQSAASTTLWVWRILYADSCILASVILARANTAHMSIGRLDQAIIIAGGGDESRLGLILSLINKISRCFLPPQMYQQKLLHNGNRLLPLQLQTASHQVPCINTNPSFISFQNIHANNPFVLRGYARDWPALNHNSWNSIDYLLSVSGSSRLVPVEVGHDYRDEHWGQVLMDWERFLYALDDTTGISKASKEGLYLAQYNLFRQFPSLRDDIAVPDYVYCSLSPEGFTGYKAPEDASGAILNVWLGPKGATSPAHFDPYYNLYIQVVGHKTVWLSPPQTSLYMGGCLLKDSRNSGSPPISEDAVPPNTSTLDVFSTKDITGDAPNFAEKVLPFAMSVELGPGDLLSFPPGWWHGMRSESTSFSVSMWF